MEENEFDVWNKKKQELDVVAHRKNFYEREVWWASLGKNIGVEINGKHELFCAP